MSPYYRKPPPAPATGPPRVDHLQGPPSKRMRKGTKSCLECRRRKIRCTFEPGTTAVCMECYARGSTCIDQEHGDVHSINLASDHAHSLRERVTHLEALVKEVVHRLPDDGERGSSAGSSAAVDAHAGNQSICQSSEEQLAVLTPPAAEALKSLRKTSTVPPTETSLPLPGGLQEDAPALSLFDNAVLTRKHEPQLISRDRYNKNKALTHALTTMLPGPRELNIILDASETWWKVQRKLFPEVADRYHNTIKESVSHSLRSEDPAEMAKMILRIAISMDQLPSDWDFSQLRLDGSPQEVIERYITTVDQLITSDDEIAGTVNGIECMVLQAKHYVNVGRPRRAWLVYRRAISFAQLLGFHRLAVMKPAKPDIQHIRQVSLWCHLFQGDRFLALILGLPLSIQPHFCDPCIPAIGQATEHLESDAFLLRISPIVAKIIDRNQSPCLDSSLTLRIDQDMQELAQSVPQEWWDKPYAPARTFEENFDRRLSQFFFHLVRKLLHLPFMLKSAADKRYQYSYTAALESSREMIRVYDAMQGSGAVGPFSCKLIDFQAFNASILILLNLYGYSRGSQNNAKQDQADSALVDTTIEILRKSSKEGSGIVAAQSLKALEMIAEPRHGCYREHCNGAVKVSIPYFGTVTVAPGKHFHVPKKGTYPRPTARTQPHKASTTAANNASVPPNASLPTPPSATASTFQLSPPPPLPIDPSASSLSSSSLSSSESMLPSTYTTSGLSYADPPYAEQQPITVSANDPFISFDSYMAVPPIGSGMEMATDRFPAGVIPGIELGAETNGINEFPWMGAGLDLDTSWNWFGTDDIAGGGGNGVQ